MQIGLYQQQDPPPDDDAITDTTQTTIRCMTRDHFRALRSIEATTDTRFQRAISDAWLARLDAGVLYPIIDARPIAGREPTIRVQVMLTDTAVVWADLPEALYDTLPQAEAASTIMAVLTNTNATNEETL